MVESLNVISILNILVSLNNEYIISNFIDNFCSSQRYISMLFKIKNDIESSVTENPILDGKFSFVSFIISTKLSRNFRHDAMALPYINWYVYIYMNLYILNYVLFILVIAIKLPECTHLLEMYYKTNYPIHF